MLSNQALVIYIIQYLQREVVILGHMQRILKILEIALPCLVVIYERRILPVEAQLAAGRNFPNVQHVYVPVVIVHVVIGIEMLRHQRLHRTILPQVVILLYIQLRPVMTQPEGEPHYIIKGVFNIENIFNSFLHLSIYL